MDKKNARKARQRKLRNRRIALTLCLMLTVAVASIGGTIAWLTASTTPVVNEFTSSDINVTLTETTTDFQMVPGSTIAKDPTAAVVAGSEACWLFVKIEESTSPVLDNYISYTVADGWKVLDGEGGVYYREVSAADAESGVSYSILKDNQVTVLGTVTKTMMEAIDGVDANGVVNTEAKPTLTFAAYAVQSENLTVTDMTEIWNLAKTAA